MNAKVEKTNELNVNAPEGSNFWDAPEPDPFRFHTNYSSLAAPFGNDKFGEKAEAFARFFGTPSFLGIQTLFVAVWIVFHAMGIFNFDPYPFILLNLAFSVQAVYAAPFILLAQTRQAARDKALTEAEVQHREALAQNNLDRQKQTVWNTKQLLLLMEKNTELTLLTKEISERIETLTVQLHAHSLIEGTSTKK